MCGIFGYVGNKSKPAGFILDGLKALEYRGYDSWGLVVLSSNKLARERHVGKIGEAKTALPATTTGMGHTRWATHGGVTVSNAHPHFDCSGRFAVVHNGIIENERELRRELVRRGHKFSSRTDTEIIAHLLEEETIIDRQLEPRRHFFNALGSESSLPSSSPPSLNKNRVFHGSSSRVSKMPPSAQLSLVDLVRGVTARLEGAFAIGVMDREKPEEMVLARLGGPLVVGVVDGYKLFASDPSALLPFTKKVIYLQDRELAWITPENVEIRSFENHRKKPDVTTLDWDVEKAKKGGHAHFMLKEMTEQPSSLTDSMRGRIKDDGSVKLGGLEMVKNQLRDAEFIRFIACGSAYYAGLYGASVIQELTGITATAEIASEYKYNSYNWPEKSTAWFISQSGETADVLGAIEKVKREKILPLGLVNVVGSSVAQRTTAGVYLHAGPEVGVASTKAFVSQLGCLAMIGCWLAQLKKEVPKRLFGLRSQNDCFFVAKELENLPNLIKKVLDLRGELRKLAGEIVSKRQIFFLGRGRNYPLALEGALKLREVCYLDTLGLPTGELKHGPIAAMDRNRPVVLFAPSDGTEMKNRSSVQELRARNIPVYVITDAAGKKKFADLAGKLIAVPNTHPILQPILIAPVVQMLAYEAGVLLKRPIDKPRNLAKSVTVE